MKKPISSILILTGGISITLGFLFISSWFWLYNLLLILTGLSLMIYAISAGK